MGRPEERSSADAGGDASGACLNWAAIVASPGKATTNSPTGPEKLGTSGEQVPARWRAAESPGRQTTGNWPHAALSRGAGKDLSGLIVRKGTYVIPGASIHTHVYP